MSIHCLRRRPAPAPRTGWRLAAVALLLSIAACGSGEDAENASPLPAGVSPLAADARIAMPAPERPACQPASIRKVFRMDAEWSGYWDHGFAAGCPRPQLPAGFDWSREMLVLASMGRRESPADSIQVVGSGVVGDSVLVVLRRTTRAGTCAEPSVRVYPRDLVRIPLDARPVRFVEEHRKLPCPAG